MVASHLRQISSTTKQQPTHTHRLLSEADGTSSDNATVTINVNNIDDNDPSVADVTVSVDENIADKPSPITINDVQMPMATLTYSITAGNTTAINEIELAVHTFTQGEPLSKPTPTMAGDVS